MEIRVRPPTRFDFWDTLDLRSDRDLSDLRKNHSRRLFNNINIGNRALTNLQIGDYLNFDHDNVIKQVRAVFALHGDTVGAQLRALRQWMMTTVITLNIGEMTRWQGTLLDISGRPPYEEYKPTPCVCGETVCVEKVPLMAFSLPVRQNVGVQVESAPDDLEAFLATISPGEAPSIQIHLEGVATSIYKSQHL